MNGFMCWLLRNGRLHMCVLVDCARAPNARAEPMVDVVFPQWVAANDVDGGTTP